MRIMISALTSATTHTLVLSCTCCTCGACCRVEAELYLWCCAAVHELAITQAVFSNEVYVGKRVNVNTLSPASPPAPPAIDVDAPGLPTAPPRSGPKLWPPRPSKRRRRSWCFHNVCRCETVRSETPACASTWTQSRGNIEIKCGLRNARATHLLAVPVNELLCILRNGTERHTHTHTY